LFVFAIVKVRQWTGGKSDGLSRWSRSGKCGLTRTSPTCAKTYTRLGKFVRRRTWKAIRPILQMRRAVEEFVFAIAQ
jgi:hypothetical protein